MIMIQALAVKSIEESILKNHTYVFLFKHLLSNANKLIKVV